MSRPLLEVQGVSKEFPVGRGWLGRPTRSLHALSDVSFTLAPGETLGLVGESGSGKSTLGRCVLQLLAPTRGSVRFEGQELTTLSPRAMRPVRRRLQIVFQDPYGSLNPRLTVRQTLGEPLRLHGLATSPSDEEAQVAELLRRVGLRPEHADRYPHEFSGGQRQRIGIARALSVRPQLVVCDEPVSALDVSVQAQIVNLLRDLSDELGLGYLFIAHDLSVVRFMSQRVAVMYLGRIVELGPAAALYETPRHPYTKALLRAVPRIATVRPGASDLQRRRLPLLGEVPSPLAPPAGCPFHPRCPEAQPGLCDRERPLLRSAGDAHEAACHLM
ncbi:MAG: ATP-binding cassette domain-containing protein [Myxococcales bacterium]